MDSEVFKNVLHVAVDGVEADAEVADDFLAVPAVAEKVENGAVTGYKREMSWLA